MQLELRMSIDLVEIVGDNLRVHVAGNVCSKQSRVLVLVAMTSNLGERYRSLQQGHPTGDYYNSHN